MAPIFLDISDILEIHRDQIERYGGNPGIRDMNLLESALGMPEAGIRGELIHSSLHEMAAAYLFHIVRNHPFIDGNKRTGAMAAFTFLQLNGLTLKASPWQFENLIRQVAEGKADKSSVTEFFRRHAGK